MKKWIVPLCVAFIFCACSSGPDNPEKVDRLPLIFPDYTDVTIPDGIAPLNFNFAGGDFEMMDVVVKGAGGEELHSRGGEADFNVGKWHALTRANAGKDLTVTVCVRQAGQWRQYKDFKIHVSKEPLEEWGLTYRRVAPGYEVYSHMGLYQRCLADFDEEPVIENTRATGQCVNCHTANRTNPRQFVFHVRGEHGATLVQTDGKREWLQAKNDSLGGSMVYPYWHPSGKYCAFSTNQTRQGFHVCRDERIEVFDNSSDIFIYNPETHEIIMDTLVMTKAYSENTPVFSPDGKYLYFTTCLQREYPKDFKKEQYNLCRIGFDPATGKLGTVVDTIFNAVRMNKSVTWPKPSYDGKYILFTLQDYGYFSIWHEESEQWLLDLRTGDAWPVKEWNSKRADSYHNWNVNSHWVVFTSRRGNGLYTRLYLAYIDENGKAAKPFLLPQRHPWDYYNSTVYSFNVPDFTSAKIRFPERQAAREILSDKRVPTRVR